MEMKQPAKLYGTQLGTAPAQNATQNAMPQLAFSDDDETTDALEAIRIRMHLKLLGIEEQIANPTLDRNLRRIEDRLNELLESCSFCATLYSCSHFAKNTYRNRRRCVASLNVDKSY